MSMQDGTMGQIPNHTYWPSLAQAAPSGMQPSQAEEGHLYQKVLPRESQEALFQLVWLTAQGETTLKGCHDDIGHLGLKGMLDLMCDHFFWAEMAIQAKEHVEKCHQYIIFKAKQQRSPMENIVVTHPLELVHINYLCLEPRKGKEENVLVATNHFTQYMQVSVTQFQTVQVMAKVCVTTSPFTTVCQRRYCLTRGGNSEVN